MCPVSAVAYEPSAVVANPANGGTTPVTANFRTQQLAPMAEATLAALSCIGYNLRRVLNLVSVPTLLAALRGELIPKRLRRGLKAGLCASERRRPLRAKILRQRPRTSKPLR